MKNYNEDPLHILTGRSTYLYMILPVISISYYRKHLHENIEALKKREDCHVEISERDEGYLEIKLTMKDKKDYTTDWDVLRERIEDINELEKENCELRRQIRSLQNYHKRH